MLPTLPVWDSIREEHTSDHITCWLNFVTLYFCGHNVITETLISERPGNVTILSNLFTLLEEHV